MDLIMAELGPLVNLVLAAAGAAVGVLFRRAIPGRLRDGLLRAMGLAVVFIGVTGLSSGKNALVTVLSLAIGAAVGEALDIDEKMNRFGDLLQKKMQGGGKISEAFVTTTLIFCIGAMAVTGAFESASGNHTVLFSKSIIDMVTGCVLATTLGVGCILAALPTFLYEGLLVAAFFFLGGFLPAETLGEISAVGSLLILAIGLNMLGITRIKVANLLPAMLLPLLLCLIPRNSFM